MYTDFLVQAQGDASVWILLTYLCVIYRQALLAAQRHSSDEKRPESARGVDNDDDKLLDVVGSPESPLHSLHSANNLAAQHPGNFLQTLYIYYYVHYVFSFSR